MDFTYCFFLVRGEERFQPSRIRASYASSADHVRTGPPALSQHRYPSLNTKIVFSFSWLTTVLYSQTSNWHLPFTFILLLLQSTGTWNPTTSWSPCPMLMVGSGPWSQTLACVRSWQWGVTVSVEGLACRAPRAGSPPRSSVRTAKTTRWVTGRVAALSWWC